MLSFLLASLLCFLQEAPVQEPTPEESAATPFKEVQPPQELTYEYLIEDLYDLRRLMQTPWPGERTFQFSSFDRASLKGSSDPEAWFANHDRGNYLREEQGAAGLEYVMAETEGPGVITRIWSANPEGEVLIYIDGSSSPALRMPFQEFLSGNTQPFLEPLVGVRGRGWNCYVPIPFQKGIKITTTASGLFYHVNVRTFADQMRVPSFSLDLVSAHAEQLVTAGTYLTGDWPKPEADRATMRSSTFRAGQTVKIDVKSGGTYRLIMLRFLQPQRIRDWDRVLRSIRVRVDADLTGTPQIDVPLGEFFGASPGFHGFRTYPFHWNDETYTMVMNLPIPYSKGIRMSFKHEGEGHERIPVRFDFAMDTQKTVGPLRLHMAWKQRKGLSTGAKSDYEIIEAEGPGRYVGTMLTIANPTRTWWGEGDEKIYIDGEEFPSIFGTGTEDFFGYAWGNNHPFDHPYISQIRCDGPGNYGYTSLNRMQISDSFVFHKSIKFDMEVWHWEDRKVDYTTTAYWYAPAESQSSREPLPDLKERLATKMEPLKIFRLAGALEAEDLRVHRITGGKARFQEMQMFGNTWSNERQLWWTDAKIGDQLILRVPVKEKGRYKLTAQFTKARDYGIIQAFLNGRPIGELLDLYNPEVISSGEIDLGIHDLTPRDHNFTLRIEGANQNAVHEFMVGLDYLFLTPVDDEPVDDEGETPKTNEEAPVVDKGLYSLQTQSLEGESVDLAAYKGKVTLVVNVASQCGYTPQYAGLENLHKELAEQGFAVLGFPSNEFGKQEPGSAAEIREFCDSRFGVTFPMFAKVEVKPGEGQSEVYRFLTRGGDVPNWNFCKYLIGKDGKVRQFFPSKVAPDHAELRAMIQAALAE